MTDKQLQQKMGQNAEFCRVCVTPRALRDNTSLDLNEREARLFLLSIEESVQELMRETAYGEIERLAQIAGIRKLS